MTNSSMIIIGDKKFRSTKQEMQLLKAVLDKLELPYILDGISFHNTLLALNRMKAIHNTNVWKVEREKIMWLTFSDRLRIVTNILVKKICHFARQWIRSYLKKRILVQNRGGREVSPR